MKIMEGITPLPWGAVGYGGWRIHPHGSGLAELVASCASVRKLETDRANAAYIAHACNMFPELVEALELAKENIEHWGAYAGEYCKEKWDLEGDIQRLEEVITRAKGEEAEQ